MSDVPKSTAFTHLYHQFRAIQDSDKSENLFMLGENLRSGSDFALDFFSSWYNDRTERLQHGADYIRQQIDQQYGNGLGRALFHSLSTPLNDLNRSVTRRDLDTIQSALAGREAAWTQATAGTLDVTRRRIDDLQKRGFPDGIKLAKEVAELQDNTMWGITTSLPQKWGDLLKRVDEAVRRADPQRIAQDIDLKLKLMLGNGESAPRMASVLQELFQEAGGAYARSDYKSVEKLHRVQRQVDRALGEWAAVEHHNREVLHFRKAAGAISDIKLQVSKHAVQDRSIENALADYDRALAACGPKGLVTAREEDLTRLRTALKKARDEVYAKYEYELSRGDPGPTAESYYRSRAQDLMVENANLISHAQSNPDMTPHARQRQRDLANALQEADAGPSADAPQSTSPHTKQTKPETTLGVSSANSADDSSGEEPVEESAGWERVRAPRDHAQRALSIARELSSSQSVATSDTTQIGTVVTIHTDQHLRALDAQIKDIALTTTGSANSSERSAKAVALVQKTDPSILARLPPESALSLLRSVLSSGTLPKSDASTKNDPVRQALRKMYSVMPLDPAFVAADHKLRQQTVERLVAEHGQELLLYRRTWLALTDDQRMKAVDLVLTAHCTALGVPKPGIKWGSELSPGAHFAPTASGDIELGKASGNDDFATVMAMVFHENTHHYQQVLANRAKEQTPVDFPTQVAIFGANIGAYVGGEEDRADYREQPIEAHAFMAGGYATKLLMQALDAEQASHA